MDSDYNMLQVSTKKYCQYYSNNMEVNRRLEVDRWLIVDLVGGYLNHESDFSYNKVAEFNMQTHFT